jgi:exonuclease SbcD
VVLTGGNHDSPGTLNAPKELLEALSIKVVGKATAEVKDEVFKLATDQEEIIVAAVPYLRDQDIRKAVAGESFDEISERYKTALKNHYSQVAEYCESIKNDKTAIIAMGHLFAVGGHVSDSEQNIYVGNLGHIGAQDFPNNFDYIALGHLHRPQMVDKQSHIRYCGSPYTLSFSEINQGKKVILIETDNNQIHKIEDISIPQFRNIVNIQGDLETCIEQMHKIESNAYLLTPWVEVILDNTSNTNLGYTEVHKAAENLDLEVLKVTLKNKRDIQGWEQLIEASKNTKALSPSEVFKLKCQEQNFDLEQHQDVMDAFNEVLHIVNKN